MDENKILNDGTSDLKGSQEYVNEILQQEIEARIDNILSDADKNLEEKTDVVFVDSSLRAGDAEESRALTVVEKKPEERIDFCFEEKPQKTRTGKRINIEASKKVKRIRLISLSCFVVVICAVLTFFVIIPRYNTSKDMVLSSAREYSYSENVEGMMAPGLKISVMQATKNIAPGESISTDCFREVKITSEEYNAARAVGKRVCLYEQAGYYIGNYATSYIASGQFFMCDSVSFINLIENSSNPWEYGGTVSFSQNKDAMQKLTIGEKVTVSIKRVIGPGQSGTAWSVYGGVKELSFATKWENGYAVEYIEATGVVSDVVMEDGSSLYSKYKTMSGIPLGDLAGMIPDIFPDSTTPKMIQIAFDTSVAESLGKLDLSNAEVTYKTSGIASGSNQQNEVVAYLEYANRTLRDAA